MKARDIWATPKVLVCILVLSLVFWAVLVVARAFDLYRPYLNGMEKKIDDYYLTEMKLNQCHDELEIRSSLENWSPIRDSCKTNGVAKRFNHSGRLEVQLGTHMSFLSATEMEYKVQRGDRSFSEVWIIGRSGLVKAELRGER